MKTDPGKPFKDAAHRIQKADEKSNNPPASDIKLGWQELVQTIRKHGIEDPEGMYLVDRNNAIVSDPDLLRVIFEARKGDYPFMMIGRWSTGKNVVVDLINRGSKRKDYQFKDENLLGTREDMDNLFFGTKLMPGVIELHDGATIHLDVMENLKDKPLIANKILTLVQQGELRRSDGSITHVDVRIIGGAKEDLPSDLRNETSASDGITILKYLVARLSAELLIYTKRLSQMPARIPTLQITEQFATLYLNGRFSADQLNKVATVPSDVIHQYQIHNWSIDNDFKEFSRSIQSAIRNGTWENVF